MINELSLASSNLQAALERYIRACSAIQDRYFQQDSIPQELSSRVADELLLATSYETQVKQAKIAISRVINCTALVPINALPTEILAQIFQLLTYGKPCIGVDHDNATKIIFPKYPDLLSCVCSRWRQVVTGTCVLWSHIDLAPLHLRSQSVVRRAEACVARAGQLPLDIHIRRMGYDYSWRQPPDMRVPQFLASCALRIESLTLSMAATTNYDHWYRTIFSACFANCEPGTLTQLTVRQKTRDCRHKFLGAAENAASSDSLILDMPGQHLEDLWAPLTVLRLHQIYPYWTSKAYHGLVELRLASSSPLTIPETELVAILKSSPGLRIFQFGLQIIDQLETDDLITPVHLGDLEVLNLRGVKVEEIGGVLRLLAPGSKPFTISLEASHNAELFLAEYDISQFFARANVTAICAQGLVRYPQIVQLFNLAPRLRALALEWFNADEGISKHGGLSMPFHLDSLYVLDHRIQWTTLCQIIEMHQVQTLIIWDCTLDQEQVLQSNVCPVIKYLTYDDPNPIEDW
jgi:hypothetical protein